MKKLWELAYEEFLDKQNNLEIFELEKAIDSKLKDLLSEKDFDEIYEMVSKVQVLIERNAFQFGFERGFNK